MPLLCANANLLTKTKDMIFDKEILFSNIFVNLKKMINSYANISAFAAIIAKIISRSPSDTIQLLLILKQNHFIDVYFIEE